MCAFHSPTQLRDRSDRQQRGKGRLLLCEIAWGTRWLPLALAGILAGSIVFTGSATPVQAQGVLIVEGEHDHPIHLPRPIHRPRPEPPVSYKIKEFGVDARIDGQISRTQVTQSFVNTGSRQMEVSFIFPLPYDGAIDSLTFMVDGKEYEAKLMPADQARQIYEGYIRRNKDPALLEWMGRGMFKTSVFPIPPGQERKVTLQYSQVLRRDRQLTDYLFPLSTAKYTSKPIEKLSFNVSIKSEGKIKSVYSPTHAVNVERPSDQQAKVSFQAQNAVPISDFRLFYDTSDASVGASLLSYWPEGEDQGFFLLLASPEIKRSAVEVPKKTVILVVDRSGSMSGKKIEQSREALKFVLNNLNENDLFNIIAYDNDVEAFRPELQKFNSETRQAALGFVNDIFAGGSTNISGAINTALDMIQDGSRPNYVVFLTDGLPTAGETNEMKIVAQSEQHNQHQARVINFGVGYDVNSRLLDRLSRAHRGQSEYVRPDEDLEMYVSRLYSRISSPVMTNVSLDFQLDISDADANGSLVNRMYPNPLPDLFQGEQLVVAGRYRRDGTAKVKVAGQVGDERQELSFAGDFNKSSGLANYAFVEKIWAIRRIGEIIDEIDLKGRNDELVKELIDLSTRHGVLTPYTSFLADDQADGIPLASESRARDQAIERLAQLGDASGQSGFDQRAGKKSLQEADRAAPASAYGGQNVGGGGGRGGAPVGRYAQGGEAIVQNVGTETLYRRGNLMIATSARGIDPEKDQDKIKVIERFSEDYFKLISDNSEEENQVLSQQAEDVELLVKLRGQVYRIK